MFIIYTTLIFLFIIINKLFFEMLLIKIVEIRRSCPLINISGFEKVNLLSSLSFENSIDIDYSLKYKQLLVDHDEIFLVIDLEGNIIYTNKIALKIFKNDYENILGESIFKLYSKHDVYDKTWFQSTLNGYENSTLIKISNKTDRWYLFRYTTNKDIFGSIETITIFGNDVTTLINDSPMKNYYTNKDYLTGLINQYGMFERIEQLDKPSKAISFFIQILKFTELTNYYGHEITNQLLNQVVKKLKSLITPDCILARYTESKFVILSLENDDINGFIEKLNSFIDNSYYINNLNLRVEIKIGYANYPKDSDNFNELLTKSSIALKEGIVNNRNNITEFESFMMDKLKQNIEIANKLKAALDDNKIEVFFQKAINCNTNEVFIVEELSRWKDEDLGYISPEEYFKVAKETNQLQRLDRYMVKKSIESFIKIRHRKELKKSKLTVNISPKSLLDVSFYQFITNLVRNSKIKAGDIYIEISESTFMNNLNLCNTKINLFRDFGFKIALDDFGTEYSSLSVLESVNFDIIKIDQHFIKNIQKVGNQEIIKMIRRIADITGKEMISEGIETKEQSEILNQLGCAIQQGYYLHRPENLSTIK